MGLLWVSHGFPIGFSWVSRGSPEGFDGFPMGLPKQLARNYVKQCRLLEWIRPASYYKRPDPSHGPGHDPWAALVISTGTGTRVFPLLIGFVLCTINIDITRLF